MTIYGLAILACCFLSGKLVGSLLGDMIGFNGDIGGVGFAMIFLIVSNQYIKDKKWFRGESENAIHFWKYMYLPIIVAMAATQNVNAAISGGMVAVLVGVIGTISCFALVPLLSGRGNENKD